MKNDIDALITKIQEHFTQRAAQTEKKLKKMVDREQKAKAAETDKYGRTFAAIREIVSGSYQRTECVIAWQGECFG
jgi:DNA-binding transcriptional regulator YbjK